MPPVEPDRVLIDSIRSALGSHADPARAPQMQTYMKSAMPYLGVPLPVVRKLTKDLERARQPQTDEQMAATARTLWREATHREYRYAANQLTDTARARKLRTVRCLPLFEEFITTGAWWDHVDETSHRIGDLLVRYPEDVRPVVVAWANSDDLWLRRASIICQLGLKAGTDCVLLTHAIDANVSDPEFFIRKAIGWALREYAKTDPTWVRQFVAEREATLSNLSKREALKHLGS